MIVFGKRQAARQGVANANYFACDYVVFEDTSGNLQLERLSRAGERARCEGVMIKPGDDEDRVFQRLGGKKEQKKRRHS